MADLLARARLLLAVAKDLDRRGYPLAGVVRDVARAVLERDWMTEDRCPRCAGPIAQPTSGRRRKYCSDRCRWAASKRPRNGPLVKP